MKWSLVIPAALLTAGVVGQVLAQEDPDVVFTPTDVRISEGSGLVVRDEDAFMVNDSGHEPLLFRVSTKSGDTVGTTRYAEENVDVEALAPGHREGVVWVGDIGDNRRVRAQVAVHRVSIADGATTSFDLAYPDGPRDAEAMVVDRRGRIFVFSKGLLAGEAYVVGPRLDPDRVNPMNRVGKVGPLVTDAALMPDQRHVLLRTYGQLSVHTFPEFRRLGSMKLPEQEQGEGLAVTGSGQVLISSEGIGEPVRRVVLTPQLKAAMSPTATSSPTPSPTPSATTEPTREDSSAEPAGESWPAWVYAGGLLGLVSVVLAVSAARRRSRHTG